MSVCIHLNCFTVNLKQKTSQAAKLKSITCILIYMFFIFYIKQALRYNINRYIKLCLDKLLGSLSYTAMNPASLSKLQTWWGCRRFLCQLLPLETLRTLAQAQPSGKGREVGERSEWVKILVRWRSVSNGEKAQSSSRYLQRSASLIGDRETCLEFMMINLVSMEATFCFL